jgi:hypothetical protein
MQVTARISLLLALVTVQAYASLYGAAFSSSENGANYTASLYKYNEAGTGSWSKVLTFGSLPPSNLAGMLSTDGSKWWLAAGESGQRGQNTLFYAESASVVHTITTKVPLTTMEYVKTADEFLSTWEAPGQNEHLCFGALDPYLGKENTMVDLTQNFSIPWSTFGVSAIDPTDLSFSFVVGIESVAGSKFSLARVWPTGHGIGVELGSACDSCTIQSVVHVEGIKEPVALTMRPAGHAKQYTYSWEPWNVSAGKPTRAPLAAWNTTAYNTFATTAAEGSVLYASDQFRGNGILKFENGEVTRLSTAGLDGYIGDLACA